MKVKIEIDTDSDTMKVSKEAPDNKKECKVKNGRDCRCMNLNEVTPSKSIERPLHD